MKFCFTSVETKCNETHTCVSLSISENYIREIDHSRGGDDELRAGGGG